MEIKNRFEVGEKVFPITYLTRTVSANELVEVTDVEGIIHQRKDTSPYIKVEYHLEDGSIFEEDELLSKDELSQIINIFRTTNLLSGMF